MGRLLTSEAIGGFFAMYYWDRIWDMGYGLWELRAVETPYGYKVLSIGAIFGIGYGSHR